jgi:hypothetical protein
MDGREQQDRVAKRAAEHFLGGRAGTPDAAVDRAIDEERRLHPGDRAPRRPSRARLRAHAQAVEESEIGTAGRTRRIEDTLLEALDLLAALEEVVVTEDPDGSTLPLPEVYGRAARGEFDLDPQVHARVTTSLSCAVLAAALADHGFSDARCGSTRTRHGVLDRIEVDGAFATHAIVRIPPRMPVEADRDLFDGRRVPHADFETLSRRLSEPR